MLELIPDKYLSHRKTIRTMKTKKYQRKNKRNGKADGIIKNKKGKQTFVTDWEADILEYVGINPG
jgi:hypothetical protein